MSEGTASNSTSLKPPTIDIFDFNRVAASKVKEIEQVDETMIPTLMSLCLQTLAYPKSLRGRLLAYRALRDINLLNSGVDQSELIKLRDQSKMEIRKSFAAILKYYEGEEDVIAQIIGEEEFKALYDDLKEREEAKEAFSKYRRGSVLKKDSSALTQEEEILFETKRILPYRVLKTGTKWPSDIDTTKREHYLSDEEFSSVFGMDRAAFDKLYSYNKTIIKKEKQMF